MALQMKWLVPFLSAALLASEAAAIDSWSLVFESGAPDLNRTDTIAIHDGFIYFGSASRVERRTFLFRAPLSDDTSWSDVTPSWELHGRLLAMHEFQGRLYVGSESGALWKTRDTDGWIAVRLPGPRGLPIWAIASVRRSDSREPMLCVLRGDAELLCLVEELDRWVEYASPLSVAARTAIGGGSLTAEGSILWLGVGGITRDSRPCAVVAYYGFDGTGRASAAVETESCFGTDLGFVTSEVFRGASYFGAGGGRIAILALDTFGFGPSPAFRPPLIPGVPQRRPRDTRIGRTRDVTPVDDGAPTISAVGDMAVAAEQLFVGVRDHEVLGRDAVVLSTGNGSEWHVSSEPGFGRIGNVGLSALGSRDAMVYAGTSNTAGLEIWRRNPPLIEIDPPLRRDLSSARRRLSDLLPCLVSSVCPPDPSEFETIMLAIDLTVETAGSPSDDPDTLKQVRADMDRSIEQLDLGLQKTAEAGKEPSRKAARILGREAARHFKASLQLAQGLQKLVASSENDGQIGDGPIGDPIEPPVAVDF